MRLLFIVSISFILCLNVQAAQNPSIDNSNSYLSQPATLYAQPSNSTPTVVESYLTPYDNAEGRLIAFLDQAQHSCYVASYSITNKNIVNELIQLHNRGVDVQVISDKSQSTGHSEQAALAALLVNHIPVFVGKSIDNALIHVKFCVIDNRYVEDGSYNYTASANHQDNILNFTDSKQRAAQFLAYWQRIKFDMQY
jgi:phosphatidylserine/phosphatidylglycerophosphate/cardiolipin synthase-like enzyme